MTVGELSPQPPTPNLQPLPGPRVLFWPTWLVAVALLAAYLAVYLEHAWALVAYPFAIDQGEGYDAYSGWLIHLGRWIYTDNSVFPYYSSNYPPLYSYLISIPMAWFGLSLASARLVSIAATLAAGWLIAVIVWRERRNSLAALCAVALFFASNYVFHTTPLVRVNALTLLLALAALASLERARGRWLVWPALLFLAALFAKQTAIDALVAGGVWLLLQGRRREMLVLLGAVGVSGALLVGALEAFSGGHFWSNVVVGNANPWDLGQALGYYLNFAKLHLVILVLAVVQTWRELGGCARGALGRAGGRSTFQAGAPGLFGVYFAASAALALGAGKWGAGESYFLALIAASCIQAGRFIASVPGSGVSQGAVAFLLVVQGVLFARGPVAALVPSPVGDGVQAAALGWNPGQREIDEGQRLTRAIQRAGGLVLAEDPGFLVAAGRPIVGNATHLRNVWEAGVWDETNLVNDIAARRYSLVLLDAQLYPPPVLEAIGRYYYLHDQVEVHDTRYLVFMPGRS